MTSLKSEGELRAAHTFPAQAVAPRRRGNGVVFGLLLVTMLIPSEVVLVPLFQQFNKLGLLNTYGALALPHIVSLLGVVLIRQFIVNLPADLTDAAQVDGASAWQRYRSAYGDIDYGVVMASTVLAVTPPLLVFLFAQRFIIQGISSTGLKG